MRLTRGQWIIHLACWIQLILLTGGYFSGSLTANPIQALTLRSGQTAVILLMLSLACRPLADIFSLSALFPIRKTLGLYAFYFATLHFLVFAGLDFEFNTAWIWDELRFKPFIQIGLAALVFLLILAVTSINNIRKSLGKNWQPLHRLVYLAAILVLIHYLMAVKGDFLQPAIIGLAFSMLMLLRIPPLSKMRLMSKPRWISSVNNFLLKT